MERNPGLRLEMFRENEDTDLQALLLKVDDRIRTGDRLDHNQAS